MDKFTLTSSAFKEGGVIPDQFTCEGDNVNPPLEINATLDGTMSLAITVIDKDIPVELQEKMGISVFVHWLAFNIPPSTKEIPENTPAGTQGVNSSGAVGYTGPCPPDEFDPAEHRYIFTAYALDTTIDLPEGATMNDFLDSVDGHVLSTADLTGRYCMQDHN